MISFYRLPKADDTNARHGYTGRDAEYLIERQGSFGYWIRVFPVSLEPLRNRSHYKESYSASNMVEAKAFVEAFDQARGELGDLGRFEKACDAAWNAWSADHDARFDKKMAGYNARLAEIRAEIAELS